MRGLHDALSTGTSPTDLATVRSVELVRANALGVPTRVEEHLVWLVKERFGHVELAGP